MPSSRTNLLFSLLLAVGMGIAAAPRPAEADNAGVSLQVFIDALSPHGQWVSVSGFSHAWRPNPEVVGADFQPYSTGGHWEYTELGWYFESDWDWGWAPFHYGHWHLDGGYGWVWIPGTEWAPAWVRWRSGGGYVGWAPLPPPGITVVIDDRPNYWCFVESRYFVHPHVYRYRLPRARYHAAFAAAPFVEHRHRHHGSSYYSGPRREHIATAVGTPIHTRTVRPPPPGAPRPGRLEGGHSSSPTRGRDRDLPPSWRRENSVRPPPASHGASMPHPGNDRPRPLPGGNAPNGPAGPGGHGASSRNNFAPPSGGGASPRPFDRNTPQPGGNRPSPHSFERRQVPNPGAASPGPSQRNIPQPGGNRPSPHSFERRASPQSGAERPMPTSPRTFDRPSPPSLGNAPRPPSGGPGHSVSPQRAGPRGGGAGPARPSRGPGPSGGGRGHSSSPHGR